MIVYIVPILCLLEFNHFVAAVHIDSFFLNITPLFAMGNISEVKLQVTEICHITIE